MERFWQPVPNLWNVPVTDNGHGRALYANPGRTLERNRGNGTWEFLARHLFSGLIGNRTP